MKRIDSAAPLFAFAAMTSSCWPIPTPWSKSLTPPPPRSVFLPQTLMIRDWWMCMIISVMFEFLEYSLEHQLPNFSECWWDHVRTHVTACLLTEESVGGVNKPQHSQQKTRLHFDQLQTSAAPIGPRLTAYRRRSRLQRSLCFWADAYFLIPWCLLGQYSPHAAIEI